MLWHDRHIFVSFAGALSLQLYQLLCCAFGRGLLLSAFSDLVRKKIYETELINIVNKTKFYACYSTRLPFDWNTPHGFLVAWSCQCAGLYEVIIFAPFFAYIFGSCSLFVNIAEDITNDVVDLNNAIKTPDTDRSELMQRLRDIIQFYTDVKE